MCTAAVVVSLCTLTSPERRGLCATDLNAASQRAEHDGAEGVVMATGAEIRAEAAFRADVVEMARWSAPLESERRPACGGVTALAVSVPAQTNSVVFR